jgi:hypothetical protein
MPKISPLISTFKKYIIKDMTEQMRGYTTMAKRLTTELKEKLKNLHNQSAENLIDELGDLRARSKALKEEEDLIKTVLEPKLKAAKEFNPNQDLISGRRYNLAVIKTFQTRLDTEAVRKVLTEDQLKECEKTIPITQYRTTKKDDPQTEPHPVEATV